MPIDKDLLQKSRPNSGYLSEATHQNDEEVSKFATIILAVSCVNMSNKNIRNNNLKIAASSITSARATVAAILVTKTR